MPPLAFLLMMPLGAPAGGAGPAIHGLEIAIAAGTGGRHGRAAATLARHVDVAPLVHGNAHGHELPPLPASAGFLAASALSVIVCVILLPMDRLGGYRWRPPDALAKNFARMGTVTLD